MVHTFIVLVACGLNHNTAPIMVRERLAWPLAMHDQLIRRWLDLPAVKEVVLLSTCNRTEVYCHIDDSPERVLAWFAHVHHVSIDRLSDYFYVHSGIDAVKHIMRVASGLDSMMLGEPQILGQLKQAYQSSQNCGALNGTLRDMFQYVFRASKNVRHNSELGRHPISVASAAIQRILQDFPEPESLNVLLIGSGETAELVGKYLYQQARHTFMVASRTSEHAQHLASKILGKAFNITDLAMHLPEADVVVSATSCPLPFISRSLVQQALARRNHTKMFFLDLAIPRDIEPEVGELHGVTLCNIDDLSASITHGLAERQSAAQNAEIMIEKAVIDYERTHRARQTKHIICNYRQRMQQLARIELKSALHKLNAGQDPETVLNEFSDKLINKITHNPTVGLKQAAWDDQSALLDLADYLFSIEDV